MRIYARQILLEDYDNVVDISFALSNYSAYCLVALVIYRFKGIIDSIANMT